MIKDRNNLLDPFLKMSKILFVFLLVFACSGGGDSGGNNNGDGGPNPPSNIIPTNLTFNVQVVGTDSSNPNGDGSGEIGRAHV